MSKRPRRKSAISLRQRAAIVLAQLYRVADVQRTNGEILANGPWLKVLANVLSSMPAAYDGDRRGRSAPAFIGLSAATLMQAAKRCGLRVTIEDIETQVADTGEWRAQLSKRPGIVRFSIMRPDKIGELLGITDDIRAEAKAWNLGTYGGSKQAREKARKERARLRDESRRRREGAVARDQYLASSLSRLQPWKEEGMSRRTWERRRAQKKDTPPTDDEPGQNGNLTQVPARQIRDAIGDASPPHLHVTQVPARQIRDRDASPCATNILITLRAQECDRDQEPSTSPASLACQEKQTCQAAQPDDEWTVRKAPGGGIIVADLIPLEGFPPIGRRLPAERRPNRALAPTRGRA